MAVLNVNGKAVDYTADPDTPLLWVLREQLGLTGTKYACGIAQCGSCTVHIDGEPVRACVTPVGGIEEDAVDGLSDRRRAGAGVHLLHPAVSARLLRGAGHRPVLPGPRAGAARRSDALLRHGGEHRLRVEPVEPQHGRGRQECRVQSRVETMHMEDGKRMDQSVGPGETPAIAKRRRIGEKVVMGEHGTLRPARGAGGI